jgi:YqaJ-like viral recombinase domain
MKSEGWGKPYENRCSFIGGSDARIIMGVDGEALLRLWREKRGEAEPPDYSENLLVQLSGVTEALNRRWYERTTGQIVKDVQSWIRHPVIRWMAATLDGIVAGILVGELDAYVELRGPAYLRPGCLGFRTNTPSPKPPLLLNAIPARSRAAWIALTASSDTCRRSFSKSTTVERPRPAASARLDCVMSNKARAALHCAGVISTIFVDSKPGNEYQ